ncbi:MAG: hypothetical protein Q8N23_28860 [Archangium sp.]|nr:hypothetical protein [Archangium sp.]MDP3156717.1 hypothetical protein [Archangium sp.]MDP3574665.1 hypothetical protein [Archangium sp.]
MTVLGRLRRKLWAWQLSRVSPQTLQALSHRALLAAFRRTLAQVPAYQELFAATGHAAREVTEVASFQRLAPLLEKDNTFQRFPLDRLTVPGVLTELASVLTSSGQGGRFAFGLSTHAMARRATEDIEFALQLNFGVDDRRTLLINCLPMGVHFAAGNCTVADVSVREDMALALLEKFRAQYEQFILVADPLFLKRLLDEARRRGFSFAGMRTHLVLGEETFGENFRSYVARALHMDPEAENHALLASSMGVGELGLNVFFETRAGIRLRRRAFREPALRAALLGRETPPEAVPLVFSYNPLQFFVEAVSPGSDGFGRLAVSTLSRQAPLPLLRYLTGDVVRVVEPALLSSWADRSRAPEAFPLPVVLIRGREADVVTASTHLSEVKDALYRDPELADQLSGAFRLTRGACTLDVQLQKFATATAEGLTAPLNALFAALLPGFSVRAWPYAQFPHGLELDYERKFKYLTAG